MSRHSMVAITVMGICLVALVLPGPAGADQGDDRETCASKYPNAPTAPPPDYDYKSEDDAYMGFRRAALKAGYTAVKKAKRDTVESGPCVGHGKHVNMSGARAANGKKPEWGYIGSMTSCDICEDTSRGPRLSRTVWRIHPEL